MLYTPRDSLDGDAWKIYDYVVRHFIGTVSYNCKYMATTLNVSVGEEGFSFSGKKLLEPGFTAVMTWQVGREGLGKNVLVGVLVFFCFDHSNEKQTFQYGVKNSSRSLVFFHCPFFHLVDYFPQIFFSKFISDLVLLFLSRP